MLEDTLVSVVIPVYNGERFLARTISSVLAQTYQFIEIIIVDNGSTDRTPSMAEAAVASDKRVRLIRVEKPGVATARNVGILQSQGKFIAPLDADDLWHPNKIASQLSLMQASSREVGVVYCWSIDIDENDFVIPPIVPKSTASGVVTVELAKGNILGNASSPLIKRSCIDAVGGYDMNLQPPGAHDWKLYLALSEICEFAVIPEYLVGYRRWTASMSGDVTAMSQSVELVERWLSEKWPNLPDEVGRQRKYCMSSYLAQQALKNKQFVSAFRHGEAAYRARPTEWLELSRFRFLARISGLKRSLRRERETPVRFHELGLR